MPNTKKILVAPANYKGSISPEAAAQSIAEGILDLDQRVELIKLPLSDGGEGFVKSLLSSGNGEMVCLEVTGPVYKKVSSYYGKIDHDIAVVEMALASGLELITEMERNPWKATTFGTGELILDAINRGCKKIIIGLGGSATNDGGLGMLQALGGKVLDLKGETVAQGANGLGDAQFFDLGELSQKIKDVEFVAACDVTNPLLGSEGASVVYGPQKGADTAMVKKLEKGLLHFNSVIERELGLYHSDLPGVGAAGGLGFGLVTFLGAKLQSGFDIVSQVTDLENKVKWADVIISGEGKIDNQTLQGKTLHRLSMMTKKYRKRLIAIGGIVEEKHKKELYSAGISEFYSIMDYAKGIDDSIGNASKYLSQIGGEIIRAHGV